MSSGVTDWNARPKASTNSSNVRAFSLRKTALTFAQHFSIGFKSGESGGKNSKRAPRASIA